MNAEEVLAERLAEWTGFDLQRGGQLAVLERILEERYRASGHASKDAYVASLGGLGDPEVARMINLITVGHTWFFRDEEQTTLFEWLLRNEIARSRVPSAWVAGCSTGEEAYTLALLGESAGVSVEVLGTDINSEALTRARRAEYNAWSIRNLPPGLRRHFHDLGPDRVALHERIRARATFEHRNLLDAPPRAAGSGGWDLILCRNVLIYFRRAEAAVVVDRLAAALAPGGLLFLGAGEVLHRAPPGCFLRQLGARFALQRGDGPGITPPPSPNGSPVSASLAPFPAVAPTVVASASPVTVKHDLLGQAVARVDAGAPEEALALCARALAEDPLSAEAHLIAGVALHVAGDAAGAVQQLRSALFLDPTQWVASFYLAMSYDRLGRPEDAKREFRNANAASKNRPSPSSLRAIEAWKDEIAVMARARSRGG